MRRHGKRYQPPAIGVLTGEARREITCEAARCEARATADVMRERHARLLNQRFARLRPVCVEEHVREVNA